MLSTALQALTSFLSKFKFALITVTVVVSLGGTYFKGRHDVQQAWDLEKATQAQAVAETKAVQAEETVKTVVQYVDRIKTVTIRGKDIIKEVPVYVTKQDDARCGVIGDGFVRMWNAANQNALPDPTGGAHEGAAKPGEPETQEQPAPERRGDAARQGGAADVPDQGAGPGAAGLDTPDAGGGRKEEGGLMSVLRRLLP
jgi:hypothetical protein